MGEEHHRGFRYYSLASVKITFESDLNWLQCYCKASRQALSDHQFLGLGGVSSFITNIIIVVLIIIISSIISKDIEKDFKIIKMSPKHRPFNSIKLSLSQTYKLNREAKYKWLL